MQEWLVFLSCLIGAFALSAAIQTVGIKAQLIDVLGKLESMEEEVKEIKELLQLREDHDLTDNDDSN